MMRNQPRKYVKKPVVVEAMRFEGISNGADVRRWMERNGAQVKYTVDYKTFQVLTLEGAMDVSEGDYVIRGVKGEFYPCKPDIFEQTYRLTDGEQERDGDMWPEQEATP